MHLAMNDAVTIDNFITVDSWLDWYCNGVVDWDPNDHNAKENLPKRVKQDWAMYTICKAICVAAYRDKVAKSKSQLACTNNVVALSQPSICM